MQKTQAFQVRLTKEENEAFKKFTEEKGETRASFARKMIREAINGEIDLLTDEKLLLKLAIRQLIGIANNLNQITGAIHAGNTQRTVDEIYLEKLRNYVNSVKDEFKNCLIKTQTRWVKKS